MKTFGFLLKHGYDIMKGYVDAETQSEAEKMILDGDHDDIINEYESDEFTDGYAIIEIWEA